MLLTRRDITITKLLGLIQRVILGTQMHHDSYGLIPSTMITHAYVFDKNRKYVWTFASYEENDELFSDRNVFPIGCIIKMEKINER